MGVLGDFFVADESDATSYDGANAFPEEDYVQGKHVTPLEAAQLLALLREVPYQVELISEFPLVHEGGEDGPWTVRLPEDMVELLAGYPDASLNELAARFAAATTEELGGLGWSQQDFEETVAELSRLARRAIAAKKRMYLWNCL